MRNLTPLLICLAFINRASVAAEPVAILDSNLSAVVKQILKRKGIEKDDFDSEDLKKIHFLDAQKKKISDLTGLEYCTSLREVRLNGNQIKSVKPLTECIELRSLDLADNVLQNIAPLQTLTKLRYLHIENNAVDSLQCVSKMPELATLIAGGNKVKDLSPLTSLKNLHALHLPNNLISDLTPLGSLTRLSTVDLRHNEVADVSPLKNLKRLRWTFLSGNKIADVSPLAEMAEQDSSREFTSYWRIHLDGNPLSDPSRDHIRTLQNAGVTVVIQKKDPVAKSPKEIPKPPAAGDDNPQ